MTDIALGIQSLDGNDNLRNFARMVGAASMSEWAELGLFDHDVKGWGPAFEQVMTRTIEAGFQVHFELNGLDITDALCGDPREWVGRYTAWELQQIVARGNWFAATSFYSNGRLLDNDELESLGIKPL